MKLIHVACALLIAPLASCSVDVSQPSDDGVSSYQLVVVDLGEGTQQYCLLDTETGALYEREDGRWREIVGALDD